MSEDCKIFTYFLTPVPKSTTLCQPTGRSFWHQYESDLIIHSINEIFKDDIIATYIYGSHVDNTYGKISTEAFYRLVKYGAEKESSTNGYVSEQANVAGIVDFVSEQFEN